MKAPAWWGADDACDAVRQQTYMMMAEHVRSCERNAAHHAKRAERAAEKKDEM